MTSLIVAKNQSWMEPRLYEFSAGEVCVFTTARPGKDLNEDSFMISETGPSSLFLAVADGVGGHQKGDVASSEAISALCEKLGSPIIDSDEGLRPQILSSFESANQRVLAVGGGAATTLVACEINRDHLRTYNVGDSRLMHMGARGKIKYFTVAHSPVGYGMEAGLIQPDDALTHEDRHLVNNVVGTVGMSMDVSTPLAMAANDLVLLASDGLYDNLKEEEIVGAITRGSLLVRMNALVEKCRFRMTNEEPEQASNPDDLTIILFRPAS